MVLTGLFNLCVFFVLMAKIGLEIFYSLSVDPGLDCRRYKVFPLKPTKTDKFNQSKTTIPLLMKCGDESIFFKLSFTLCKAEQPLRGLELQEKEKDENHGGNCIKNPFIY